MKKMLQAVVLLITAAALIQTISFANVGDNRDFNKSQIRSGGWSPGV